MPILSAWIQFIKDRRLLDQFIRKNPFFYFAARSLLSKFDESDPEERLKISLQRLSEILKMASKTTYGSTIVPSDTLSDWPLLDKENVRDRGSELLHPCLNWHINVRASTGGSTGVPLKLVRSMRSIAFEQASLDHVLHKAAFQPERAKIAVLRADSFKDANDTTPPYWKYTHQGNRLVFSANHLDRSTLPQFIQELNRFQPTLLTAYPSSLESLLALAEEQSLPIRISHILTSSEILTQTLREKSETFAQAKVIDLYGQAERVALSYSLAAGESYFVPGYGFVELKYQDSDAQFDHYEIVGTGLHNHLMPLVRYRTGDSIRVKKGTSESELREIALGLRPFHSIAGRKDDYLATKEGGRLIGMNHIPRNINNIIQMQMIQHDWNRIEIRVIPGKNYSKEDEIALLHNVYAKLPDTFHVEITKTDRLVKTMSGKLPFVIRHISLE